MSQATIRMSVCSEKGRFRYTPKMASRRADYLEYLSILKKLTTAIAALVSNLGRTR